MLKTMDGRCYLEILNSGIKNVLKYKKEINDLNVFPVPDGDTGTNMVMTLTAGYSSLKNNDYTLSDVANLFAAAAVFGARGNSGVIVSQFFKGMAESFDGTVDADCVLISKALENGCTRAYSAVAHPVEGTMLTVLKDAANAVKEKLPIQSVEELIDTYLAAAELSLKNTPELLPVLKKARVVDSGASGLVRFFQGAKMFLNGEEILDAVSKEIEVAVTIDYSKFNKNTVFNYGYCVSGLIQLKVETKDFDLEKFSEKLSTVGESVVVSLEQGKVNFHLHTPTLAPAFVVIQSVGELLTVQVDNMTVQEVMKEKEKFLVAEQDTESQFSVIAVAPNAFMQQKFLEMGADVVILGEIVPSAQDFLDAFEMVKTQEILVFPNSANTIMAAEQAAKMCASKEIETVNSRSVANCYVALSGLDFDGDVRSAKDCATESIAAVYEVGVCEATKNSVFESYQIEKGDYFAISNREVLSLSKSFTEALVTAVKKVAAERDCYLLTLFYGDAVSEARIEIIKEEIDALNLDVEVSTVYTGEKQYQAVIVFE